MKILDFIKKPELDSYDAFLTYEIFKCDAELCRMRKAPMLASALHRNGIKYIRKDPKNERIILYTKDNLLIAINDHWAIFHEIFCAKIYELDEELANKPFALFDLGMNRAYASLYFSTYENCKIIYGYEPNPTTIEFARYNLALNQEHLRSKNKIINVFEYGLGEKDGTVLLNCFANRDGISTIEGCPNSILSKKEFKKAQRIPVVIKSVTKEFNKRFSEIEKQNLRKIMKIDVEGAEYEIIEALCKTGQIKSFDAIFGESHDGISSIKNKLESNGFVLKHLGGEKKCNDFLFVKGESMD